MKTLKGWAMILKVKAGSGTGKEWYWFESLSLDGKSGVYADAVGKKFCMDCHKFGKDHFMSPFPLQ